MYPPIAVVVHYYFKMFYVYGRWSRHPHLETTQTCVLNFCCVSRLISDDQTTFAGEMAEYAAPSSLLSVRFYILTLHNKLI